MCFIQGEGVEVEVQDGINGSPGRARSDLPVGSGQWASAEGCLDCGSGRYYLVTVSKSFAVCGMVHKFRLGGAFHRLLIDGIDQNTGSDLTTFVCLTLTYRAAVSSAITTGDNASRAGKMQAAMMRCCCDFFMCLPSMTACRAHVVQGADRVN